MTQIILDDMYFKSGRPWIDVRAYGAVGDNSTDNGPAIQAALNAASAGYPVFLSQGVYMIRQPLVLPAGVKFFGVGQSGSILNTDVDINMITFNLNGTGSSELSSMTINGYQNTSASQNTVYIPFGYGYQTGHVLRDLHITGGFRCMYTFGVDCLFENIYAGNCFGANVWASQGSSWYIRCKFDSERSIPYGFAQASYPYPSGSASSTMNSFVQCDFTGPYGQNINFNDAMGGLMVMSQCNGLNIIDIINCGWVSFSQCQFGTTFTNSSAGVIAISDSLALGNIVIAGNKRISNCVNIS